MPKKSNPILKGTNSNLRHSLDSGVRDFADLLEIHRSHLSRFENHSTSLPPKSRKLYDALEVSIRSDIIHRDAVTEFRLIENNVYQEWMDKQRPILNTRLLVLENQLRNMDTEYTRGIEVLRKLSCISFTTTGKTLKNQQNWLNGLIAHQMHKLRRFDKSRQADLKAKIAGVKALLEM